MIDVSAAVAATLDGPPQDRAILYGDRWMNWGDARALANAVEDGIRASGCGPNDAVGFVARNRGTHAAVLAALVAYRRPISMIYAFQSPQVLARDIATLNLAAVIASEDDWSDAAIDAAEITGTSRISISDAPPFAVMVSHPLPRGGWGRRVLPEPGIEILSSGTTGPPKRIFHRTAVLFRSVAANVDPSAEDRTMPHLVFWPVGGIGGTLQLARAMIAGNPVEIIERFSVEAVVDAIKRHKMTAIGLTPTMVRMIYDADVPKEDLASLTTIYGGAGPLDIDMQDRMEERYGIPILWALGATEFCGSVICWTPEMKRTYGAVKRGSTGRAMAGCDLRVAEEATGETLPAGATGRLEVRVSALGPDWIRTTDLVLIDEDGFVFHQGRSDGAIIRGGFKVVPEKVNEALRLHPGVAEVAVVGVDDYRLGSIPVAMVVKRAGHEGLDAGQLDAHARGHLASPQVPARYHFVDALPYTASTKVNIKALQDMLDRWSVDDDSTSPSP